MSDEELSSALANIDINIVTVAGAPSIETTTKSTASEEDELSNTLKELTIEAAAAVVIPSTVDGSKPSTPNKDSSFSDELGSGSDRSGALVTWAHPELYRSSNPRSHKKIQTIPSKIGEDSKIPLDSAPSVNRTEEEVRVFTSLPLKVHLDAGFAEMEGGKLTWKEEEGKTPPPITPLMRPSDDGSVMGSAGNDNSDVMVMNLEDFSPADHPIKPYSMLVHPSPQRCMSAVPGNVQTAVDLHIRMEANERELEIEVEMDEINYEEDDDDDDVSMSSVEFILDKNSPSKTVSTTTGGYFERRRPVEEMHWTSEHRAKYGWSAGGYHHTHSNKNYRTSESSEGIAGPNYKHGNASNYTLGDSTAYQKLNQSTESLADSPLSGGSGSAGRKRKGKANSSDATRYAKDATKYKPKTYRTSVTDSIKSSPSDAFDELDPFSKGKKAAKTPSKTPAKRITPPKPPKPQVKVSPDSASGLPEDEVDYENITGSNFSIDLNLEDSGARDRTLSPGPFSPAAPSGSKPKAEATQSINFLSSPIGPPPGQFSYAKALAFPKPVRNSKDLDKDPDSYPVISGANQNPIQRLMRENILRDKLLEQKAAPSYAAMLGSPSPSPAPASVAPQPLYSVEAPAHTLSELKKGSRRLHEKEITQKSLLQMQPAPKANPKPGPTTTAFNAAGPPSRIPIPAGSSSNASSVPPPPSVHDPWDDFSAPTGHVGIGGFPAAPPKKKNKKKTGKATTEWVRSQPLKRMVQEANRNTPGAGYVEMDAEGFTSVVGSRNKNRSAGAGGATGRPGGTAGSVAVGRGMGDVSGRGGSSSAPEARGRQAGNDDEGLDYGT